MKKVSSLWTLLPWFVPMRLLPASWAENVERAVYDGMTRAEWFRAQVIEIGCTCSTDAINMCPVCVATKGGPSESNSEDPSR
jgi:hypothetical protein